MTLFAILGALDCVLLTGVFLKNPVLRSFLWDFAALNLCCLLFALECLLLVRPNANPGVEVYLDYYWKLIGIWAVTFAIIVARWWRGKSKNVGIKQ